MSDPADDAAKALAMKQSAIANSMVDYCQDDAGFSPGQSIIVLARAMALTLFRAEGEVTDKRLEAIKDYIKDTYTVLCLDHASKTKVH